MMSTNPNTSFELATLRSAISFENHAEFFKKNSIVYIVLDLQKYLVFTPAMIKMVITEADDYGNITDVKAMMQIKGYDESHSFSLSEFNGQSVNVGDEFPPHNYSRIFSNRDHAKDYAESIEYVRSLANDVLWGFLQKGNFGVPPENA